MPEAKVSEVDASVGEIIGLHPNLWSLIRRTVDFMRELAKHGNVILIGRGSNFATARIRNGLHVRLVAPASKREAHMAKLLGISIAEARHHIRKIDGQRRDFVRSIFNTDIANPTAYDIVLNMARIDIEDAAKLIAGMVKTPARVG
jgi:cytidylate kinase